jgi:GrpB-like predicted nucleotidyltransferase (UPF0157 family)
MGSDPVVIVEYDPTWPVRFAALAARTAAALGPIPVAIEHVGSTTVPGFVARGTTDRDAYRAGKVEFIDSRGAS